MLSEDRKAQDARRYWDHAASTFDDEPDHGLRDPILRETWADFLQRSVPYKHATVLDIGCGTGSLSVVLAGLGHDVTGIDLSPSMIALAREKAKLQGAQIVFHVMDAASPHLPPNHFDAIVCRHLLWVFPEPKEVLQKWAELLKQKGRLILIEGHWGNGGGLHAQQIMESLPDSCTDASVRNLSENRNFWGKDVNDERYAVIADKTR